MAGIVSPVSIATVAESTISIAKSIAKAVVVEKQTIHEQPVIEPVESPAPTEAEASKSAKVRIQIDRRIVTVTVVGIEQVRVGAVLRRPPHVSWIVLRRVDDIGIGGLNVNGLLVGILRILLDGDVLLRVTLQSAVGLGRCAHGLNGVHDIGLLGQEGIAQSPGPADVASQQSHYIRKRDQSLNAGIPVLLLGGFDKFLTTQVSRLPHPLLGLDDFKRIGSGCQHLAEQGVGIQRDRGNQVVQFLRRENLRGLLRRGTGRRSDRRRQGSLLSEQGGGE